MRLPILTIASVLLTAILMALPDHHNMLYFELSSIQSGEWWRLLTGHFIHSDWEHWFWNIAALAILGGYLEKQSVYLWIMGILVGIVGVNTLLLSDWSHVSRYCGLSGVLNTFLVIALYNYWREIRSGWVVIASIICLAKLMLELFSGTSLLTHISWPPFPPAHLAGTVAGLLLLLGIKHRFFPWRIA
ncbi:MAG: rhombosortase [Candidatus Thiodiazotropha sp. L084R]